MTQMDESNGVGLFRDAPKSAISWVIWMFAGLGCLAVIAILLISEGKTKPAVNLNQMPDAYAANLAISNILMSQASNLAGGKMTYIDGTIQNNGPATVTGVTVSVIFYNDMGVQPQVETQAIQLIRAREPYIDTEPVEAAPIKPGDSRDFRLIFEQVTDNWNQSTPEIKVLTVETK
jgi:hypothetical protein